MKYLSLLFLLSQVAQAENLFSSVKEKCSKYPLVCSFVSATVIGYPVWLFTKKKSPVRRRPAGGAPIAAAAPAARGPRQPPANGPGRQRPAPSPDDLNLQRAIEASLSLAGRGPDQPSAEEVEKNELDLVTTLSVSTAEFEKAQQEQKRKKGILSWAQSTKIIFRDEAGDYWMGNVILSEERLISLMTDAASPVQDDSFEPSDYQVNEIANILAECGNAIQGTNILIAFVQMRLIEKEIRLGLNEAQIGQVIRSIINPD